MLGWWWNVRQGGGFQLPYIEAYAVFEDSLKKVNGSQGRPFIWNDVDCYGYPSAVPNARGDLGMIVHTSNVAINHRPNVAITMVDDFENAPPGFAFATVANSNARPSDNVWGDYNTIRVFEPSKLVWVAASHVIRQDINCTTCSEPLFVVFGRERDEESWIRWEGR